MMTPGKAEIQKRLKELGIPFKMTPFEQEKMQVAWCEYGSDTPDILTSIYEGVKIAVCIL